MPSSANDIKLELAEFEVIAALTYKESGLQLVAEKLSMIQSRLRHRLKAVEMHSYKDYAEFVSSNQGKNERLNMISALTTNVSHFFRENHHFEKLASSIAAIASQSAPIRIWSAGCSNGQEAVSIAITLLESLSNIQSYDVKILATDIDPNVVSFASRGIYDDRHLGAVPSSLKKKYFSKIYSENQEQYKTIDQVRKLITFKELNLLSEWPMKIPMQYVFCRNVVIYFDAKTQDKLWPRFHAQLDPSGFLFLGHSERIADAELVGFQSDGPTTYRPITTRYNQQIDLR